MLKAKYLKCHSFFEVHKSGGTSLVWQSIMSSRPFLKKRVCYKISNGLTINPWSDSWVESLPNRTPILKEGVDARQWSKVVELRMEDGFGWNVSVLRHLCNTETVEAILKTSWPNNQEEEDRPFWLGSNTGTFSVGSCYI